MRTFILLFLVVGAALSPLVQAQGEEPVNPGPELDDMEIHFAGNTRSTSSVDLISDRGTTLRFQATATDEGPNGSLGEVVAVIAHMQRIDSRTPQPNIDIPLQRCRFGDHPSVPCGAGSDDVWWGDLQTDDRRLTVGEWGIWYTAFDREGSITDTFPEDGLENGIIFEVSADDAPSSPFRIGLAGEEDASVIQTPHFLGPGDALIVNVTMPERADPDEDPLEGLLVWKVTYQTTQVIDGKQVTTEERKIPLPDDLASVVTVQTEENPATSFTFPIQLLETALLEGDQSVAFRVYDRAGRSTSFTMQHVVVDRTPPSVFLSVPEEVPQSVPQPVFVFVEDATCSIIGGFQDETSGLMDPDIPCHSLRLTVQGQVFRMAQTAANTTGCPSLGFTITTGCYQLNLTLLELGSADVHATVTDHVGLRGFGQASTEVVRARTDFALRTLATLDPYALPGDPIRFEATVEHINGTVGLPFTLNLQAEGQNGSTVLFVEPGRQETTRFTQQTLQAPGDAPFLPGTHILNATVDVSPGAEVLGNGTRSREVPFEVFAGRVDHYDLGTFFIRTDANGFPVEAVPAPNADEAVQGQTFELRLEERAVADGDTPKGGSVYVFEAANTTLTWDPISKQIVEDVLFDTEHGAYYVIECTKANKPQYGCSPAKEGDPVNYVAVPVDGGDPIEMTLAADASNGDYDKDARPKDVAKDMGLDPEQVYVFPVDRQPFLWNPADASPAARLITYDAKPASEPPVEKDSPGIPLAAALALLGTATLLHRRRMGRRP